MNYKLAITTLLITNLGLAQLKVNAESDWGYEDIPPVAPAAKPASIAPNSANPTSTQAKSKLSLQVQPPAVRPAAAAPNTLKTVPIQTKATPLAPIKPKEPNQQIQTPQSASASPARPNSQTTRSQAISPQLNQTQEAPKLHLSPEQRQQIALGEWMELLLLITDDPGAQPDKRLWEQALQKSLSEKGGYKLLSISSFWPDLKSYIDKHPGQDENYRFLLRSLLRHEAEARRLSGQASGFSDLLFEVLGPEAISVQSESKIPSLSESVVHAYCDMACLMYEQRNPGKTVDADDNRLTFTKVIKDKFTNAPGDKERLAMLNFDLTWAKFRILWAGLNAKERKTLLANWSQLVDSPAYLAKTDPMLFSVFNSPALYGSKQ